MIFVTLGQRAEWNVSKRRHLPDMKLALPPSAWQQVRRRLLEGHLEAGVVLSTDRLQYPVKKRQGFCPQNADDAGYCDAVC